MICWLAVAGTLASPIVPSAVAGTYSWQLPTATAPGPSNPDQDSYGAAPWSYVEGNAPSAAASTAFGNLSIYSTSIDGGLTGWTDSADAAFVADNRTSSTIDVVPPGQLALRPDSAKVVAIGWTSPMSSTQTVAVNGSFTPDSPGLCAGQPNWTLEQGATVIASGSGGQITASSTVAPGSTLYLVVGYTGIYSSSCDTAGVSLGLQAPSTPPSVSLTSPQADQTIAGAQPTFSGAASSGFGDSSNVTVRVWKGSSASGDPVETLGTQRSGASYAAQPTAALANGTYTAQAEQDDLAGDSGLSAPVSFTIHNVAPTVKLTGLSGKPLVTSTPLISGTAGNADGDAGVIGVGVWAGKSIVGSALRYLQTTRDRAGRWSVRITPGLPDGRYTVLAAQQGPGESLGVSDPVALVIKAHPPALTLEQPASSVHTGAFVLAGRGGSELGDDPVVAVSIYRGRRARGRALARYRPAITGGRWRWTVRRRLAPGTYTVLVVQHDDAGHTSRVTRTVKLLAPPAVIAALPALGASGVASLRVTCTARSGDCTGYALVETVEAYQPLSGGPRGRLRVLFVYIDAAGGSTQSVRRRVAPYVVAALRRAGRVRVRTTVQLRTSSGQAINAAAVSELRLSR